MSGIYYDWNPWHGCTKLSPGCKYCYVYRGDERRGNSDKARVCHKTNDFDLPLKRKRDKSYRIPSGSVVFTCFTSDFLLDSADSWRDDCWAMIRARSDCWFYFFTKRIDRLPECLPLDWEGGYDNVIIGCTVENQDRADYRLPIFKSLPIKHKAIIVAPMIESIDISAYLDDSIEEVSVSGESGPESRPCDFDWVLKVRESCVQKGIPFFYHQTGTRFIKDGKQYLIPKKIQKSQAKKAGIDYKIGKYQIPETACYREAADYWVMKTSTSDTNEDDFDSEQLSLFDDEDLGL